MGRAEQALYVTKELRRRIRISIWNMSSPTARHEPCIELSTGKATAQNGAALLAAMDGEVERGRSATKIDNLHSTCQRLMRGAQLTLDEFSMFPFRPKPLPMLTTLPALSLTLPSV